MARKTGFVRRNNVMVRETFWIGGSIVVTTLAAASTATIVTSLSAGALALRPFTVIRTRGVWFTESDQTAAAERYAVSYGIAVVSTQASAIGVTAVPTPATDNDSDLWYMFETAVDTIEVTTDIGRFIGKQQMSIDSKAARKVEDGQDIVDVVETHAVSSGAVAVTFNRTLIKLH